MPATTWFKAPASGPCRGCISGRRGPGSTVGCIASCKTSGSTNCGQGGGARSRPSPRRSMPSPAATPNRRRRCAPASDAALEAPMAPSLAALFAAPPSADAAKIIPFPARPRAGTAARLAIAASLAALLVGLAGGYSLRGLDAPLRPASDGTADPTADRFTAALYQALDRGRPGD